MTREQDAAAIEELGARWQDAWNARDADALTALLAEDVDFVTVLGPRFGTSGTVRRGPGSSPGSWSGVTAPG